MTRPVRLLLVDDHALFTDGLRELLSFHHDLEVVGTAETAEQALTQVRQLAPDLVLMDLHLPRLDGASATRRITDQYPATAVLVLTMYDDDASLFAVLRAGARGYILKGTHQDEFVAAVRAVARGEAVFGARVADRVLAHFANPQPHQAILPELTERERQVLRLLSVGHPTHDIAVQLGLSPKTVRNHLSNVFTKLQVADRTQAVLLARRAGLTGQ